MNFRITTLWAFTTIGDDGDEGIVGFLDSEARWVPLIASDRVRLDQYVGIARSIATKTGKTIKLSKYGGRLDLEIIKPQM